MTKKLLNSGHYKSQSKVLTKGPDLNVLILYAGVFGITISRICVCVCVCVCVCEPSCVIVGEDERT